VDFFESQNLARRKSNILLLLFVVAVLSLIAMTNILVMVMLQISSTETLSSGVSPYSWESAALVSIAVIVLVGLTSAIRLFTLRNGGAAIAESMNGTLISSADSDFHKRRLLNVVEEMAIASGTPVPPVYLIDEPSINAFAAGYSPADAVIGITRGALDNLNRDQLQGVIAHEFSHIMNGDMRLNIRLVGVLYGILVLAFVGRLVLGSGGRSRGKDSGGAILAIGLGLIVIGYTGKLFGDLIKAAVSRQREYLADASAVQFTRNPAGISGALKRIGGLSEGAEVKNAHSEEFSHMYFADGLKSYFSLMSTHPDLGERIKRIEPDWEGNYLLETISDSTEETTGISGFAASGKLSADAAIASVGNPSEQNLATARDLLRAIPSAINEAARDPYLARAVVYLLLLDNDESVRAEQLTHLEQRADFIVYEGVTKLIPEISNITDAIRLPILELVLPTLRQLSREQFELFRDNMSALIHADNRITLGEWVMQTFVMRNLSVQFEGKPSRPGNRSLKALKIPCQKLLSLLATSNQQQGITTEQAFTAGQQELGLNISLMTDNLSISDYDDVIDQLLTLHPLKKPKLLKACIETITADQEVRPIEVELVRTISVCLDCPMPPITLS